jgi:protein-S-isoprenylcysteine O-methyltransferase Ste14
MIQRAPRGTAWVVVQMGLLAAVFVVAPWYRGDWPALISLLPAAMLLGLAAWTGIAGVRALGKNLTPLPAPSSNSTLVTDGIYGKIRHPLYTSLMALGLGWAFAFSSAAGLGLAVVLCIFLHAKARHEEALLCLRFPEYPDYRRRVPRYLPRWF